jgi:predicted ester cyclase
MPFDNKALSRRWFDEVWNKRNRQAIYELSHPDVTTYGLADGEKAIGIPGFLPFFDRFVATFPDIHITVEDVIAEGDKTAIRLTATGTHTGDAMGIAPTGRRVKLTGLIMVRWKDGQIIEGWNEFDAWGMMQQLVGKPAMMVKG